MSCSDFQMVVAHALGVLGNKVVCRVKRMGKYMFIYYTVLYKNQVELVTTGIATNILKKKSNVLRTPRTCRRFYCYRIQGY